jgi:hypothetical protein
MPRSRRYDEISELNLSNIDRQVGLLQIALANASRSLTPFKPHYEAISDLNRALSKALNLLKGRDADYEAPHRSVMQGNRASSVNEKAADDCTANRSKEDPADRPG